MWLKACLPDSWWEFAFATANHVYNRTSIKRLKWKIPQEIFTGEKPKISHLYVFGYKAYVYLPNEVRINKLIPCSKLMIFIRYENNGYIFIYHTQRNVIFCSIQAIFDEGHFPRYLFVINFIWPYLHQFFNDFHSLNGTQKPLKRPFNWYQSCLEAINIGQYIK